MDQLDHVTQGCGINYNFYSCNAKNLYCPQARSQQQEVEERHQAEIDGMKKEISALTSDLYQRDGSIAALNSQLSSVERQLSNVCQHKDRQEAELKVWSLTIKWSRSSVLLLVVKGGVHMDSTSQKYTFPNKFCVEI